MRENGQVQKDFGAIEGQLEARIKSAGAGTAKRSNFGIDMLKMYSIQGIFLGGAICSGASHSIDHGDIVSRHNVSISHHSKVILPSTYSAYATGLIFNMPTLY